MSEALPGSSPFVSWGTTSPAASFTLDASFVVPLLSDSDDTPSGFVSAGFAGTPSGFAEAPSGFVEAPSGFVEAPSGFAEAPSGFVEAPSGLAEAPSGLAGSLSGFAEAASKPPGRRRLTMASTSSWTISTSSSSTLPFVWLSPSSLTSGGFAGLAAGVGRLLGGGTLSRGTGIGGRRFRNSASGVGRYWGTLWAGM